MPTDWKSVYEDTLALLTTSSSDPELQKCAPGDDHRVMTDRILNLAQRQLQELNKYRFAESDESSRKRRRIMTDKADSTLNYPVKLREKSPSFMEFCDYINADDAKPFILDNIIDHWPALNDHPWASMRYLLSVAGERLVPVELGSQYTEASWSQRLMPFHEFVESYIEKGKDENADIAYLAQHDLFHQIPRLQEDIVVPDYCYVSPKLTQYYERQPSDIVTNAWFGPGGTISPLHHDPYHNLLAQVVGSKYIRLYSPEQSARLYPHTGMMSNTSQVQIENVDEGLFPEFKNVPYIECILKAGQVLYIPATGCTLLRDIKQHTVVNIYGLVTGFKPPRKTKGTGMVLSLDDGDIRVIKILQDWATEIVRSKTGNHTQSAQTQANISQPILPIDSNKRRCTIAEIIRSRMFLDLVAEVVAFFHDTERCVSQLMLVDYTINEQLGEHAVDRFGVSGRRIIMCTLYDEHHTECPPLAAGNFVIVRNANSKVDRNQIMELRVNGDRSRKLMRCGVRLLEMGDPQLVPLLERRQEYLRSMLQEQGRQKLLPMVESKAKVWTVTKHKDIKETPLRAIALSKMAVERFKVRACVVGYKPANIKDMVRPWCSECGQSLYTDEDAASELKEQIDAMCPSGKSSNVWMDFCVQSYEVSIDGKKDRRFRVFDTELKIH
ncbi:Lysine-specific demethylase 8 [Umbelopsis nana]